MTGPARWRSWAGLGLLFLVTVWLRLPLLDRPLAYHHEWVTAHILIVLQNWWEGGIAHFYYNPVITWQNPGDRGIGWEEFLLLTDTAGNYYHASYPQLGYWLPYAVFCVLGVRPGILGLQIFNLALCGLSVLLIFAVLRRLYRGQPGGEAASWWGAGLYLFLPGTLWFQSNTYFLDMLMQPLFIGYGLCLLGLMQEPERKRWWVWSGAVLALLALTEWIAVFCAVTMVMIFVLRGQWRSHWRGLLGLLLVTGVCLLFLIVVLARMRSVPEVLQFLAAKYLVRSGLKHGSQPFSAAIFKVYLFFRHNLDPLLKLLVLQVLALAICLRGRWRGVWTSAEGSLLFLMTLPVALHYGALFGFNSVHDYGTLKAEPALCFLSAMLFHHLVYRSGFALRRTVPWLALGGAACIGLSVQRYYAANFAGKPMPAFRDLGQAMAAAVQPDEVAVLETPYTYVSPQISFYAKRSILWYRGEAELREHLRQQGLTRAVVFRADLDNRLIGQRRIEAVAR